MAGALKRWNGNEWVTVSGLTVISGGGVYAPEAYNTSGIYTYFFMDFKTQLYNPSLSRLQATLKVYHEENRIQITNFAHVSGAIYKLYADFSGNLQRVVITGADDGFLTFVGGQQVPSFFTSFIIDNTDHDNLPIIEESATINYFGVNSVVETVDATTV